MTREAPVPGYRAEQAAGFVGEAYAARRRLQERLDNQDRMIGAVVRDARAVGLSWATIAAAAGVTARAVVKASERAR